MNFYKKMMQSPIMAAIYIEMDIKMCTVNHEGWSLGNHTHFRAIIE